jgi:hypothetical protein
VPAILEIKDDPTYGTFWMECIGILDYLELVHLGDTYPDIDSTKLFHKIHPLKFFRTAAINQETLHEHVKYIPGREGNYYHGCERVAIFVATERVNKNWDYHASKYADDMKRLGHKGKRKFPGVAPLKKIEAWQNSIPDHWLVPEWLEQCATLEDIIAMDQKMNSPCKRCLVKF